MLSQQVLYFPGRYTGSMGRADNCAHGCTGNAIKLQAFLLQAGIHFLCVFQVFFRFRPGVFIDVAGHCDESPLKDALAEVAEKGDEVRVLGSYPVAIL